MASPDEYRSYLAELGLENLELSVSNVTEATAALRECGRLLKLLRQAKRNVNQDIRELREEYRRRISSAGEGVSTLVGLFGKRGAAGRIRAESKRAERRERDRVLAPYQEVKLRMDDLVTQLQNAKLQLQGYVEQKKAEEASVGEQDSISADDGAEAAFCPQCGKGVGPEDRFCRQCGANLST